MDFLPESGETAADQGEPLAAIKGDKTLAELARQFDVHPNQITAWRAQLLGGAGRGGAEKVFGGSASAPPPVDVNTLHAKIGRLTLERIFPHPIALSHGATH